MLLIVIEIALALLVALLIWHGIKDSRATPSRSHRNRLYVRSEASTTRDTPGGLLILLALYVGVPVALGTAIVAIGTVVKFLTRP
jgi:hypothetical protein